MPKQTPAQSEHGPVPGYDLQDIFDNAPISIFTSTPEGRYISVNRATARMLGYDTQQEMIESVTDIAAQVYADPADRVKFMRLMEEHGEVTNHECRFRRRDGSEFWVSRNVRAVKDQEGRIVAYQGFSAEITDRKQADQELREKTQRLNSITENMFDMVSITDLEGNYRYLGPSHAILGYDLDVMIGKNVMELVHPDDYQAVATAFANFLANSEDGRKVEYRYRRADGSYLWFETVGKFILDEQGNPKEILFSTRDFTARKQAEEALEKRLVALTQPLDSSEWFGFEEMFSIAELQRLQDDFAKATKVAALITHPDGTAITMPSNFCRLCEIIRKTEIGRANCIKSDSVLGRMNPGGPVVQPCLSGGLWDAGAAIYVGDRHIANWLIGQVRDEEQDEEKIRAYARGIGADEDAVAEAFREVPAMSRQQFEQIANALFTLATQLSNTAYQNVQQARLITERNRAEEALRESEERFKRMVNEAPLGIAITDSLNSKFFLVNPALARMTGLSTEELERIDWVRITHPDDIQPDKDNMAAMNAGKIPGFQMEKRYLHADGQYFWVNITVSPMLVEDKSKPRHLLMVEDITERKKAEKMLRESLTRYDELVANVLVGVYIFWTRANGHLEFEYVSNRWCEIHQLKREDVLADVTRANSQVHPDEQDAFLLRNQDSFRDQVPFTWEGRFFIGDGNLRWLRLESTPIVFENGDIRWFGVTSDITEHKLSEEALIRSRKILTQAEELAGLGSWEWNINNDTWLLSDNWKRIHGVSDIQLTTLQLLPIAHPEDRPAIEEAFARATETGEPYEIEHRIVRQDTGEVRIVHSRGLVEMDSNGKPKAMVGAVQDITNLKQAHNLLVESEARFRSLFENSPVAYQSLNEEGCYIDVNERLSELLGYERSEILGKNFGELWSKRTRHIYPETFDGFKYSGCFKGELELIHKGGSALFVLLEGRTQRDPEGKFIRTHCILSDITERKRAEEKIRVINEQLQKANAEKDMLFSIIAHDLKSPMSGLVGSTQMLAMEPELFSEQDFRFLATEMHKNARNTFELLEDLLQWARMSQGGMVYTPTPTSLNDLMTMGLSTGQDMARAKDIAIRKDVPQGLTVLVDQPMLKTVIRNVLLNAFKFTPRGGEIAISAHREGQNVTMAIQDNGIGMNEQVLSSIFTLVKDKCQLGTEGEKGTGLGLVLCKQFIEQHGGVIWVESVPGKGTTVFFTLPLAEAP